jgi:hypothetical protein
MCRFRIVKRRRAPWVDHISDDNADDSHAPNYVHDTCFRTALCLFSDLACSWLYGGQGCK